MIESMNNAFSVPEGKVSNYIDKAIFDQVFKEVQKTYDGLLNKNNEKLN